MTTATVVTLEKVGARVYLVNLPFAAKDSAKAALGMGGNNFDRERRQWWVGAAKLGAATEFVAKLNAGDVAPAEENLNDKRVYAKVTHQGKNYFVIGQTLDANRLPLRVRLIGFADASVPFWIDAQACELVKEYHGRPERGAYGRETGRTIYQTLGGIRSFVAGQKKAEAAGVPRCCGCGLRSNNLIEDLEDGLMKCRQCCDIQSE